MRGSVDVMKAVVREARVSGNGANAASAAQCDKVLKNKSQREARSAHEMRAVVAAALVCLCR